MVLPSSWGLTCASSKNSGKDKSLRTIVNSSANQMMNSHEAWDVPLARQSGMGPWGSIKETAALRATRLSPHLCNSSPAVLIPRILRNRKRMLPQIVGLPPPFVDGGRWPCALDPDLTQHLWWVKSHVWSVIALETCLEYPSGVRLRHWIARKTSFEKFDSC